MLCIFESAVHVILYSQRLGNVQWICWPLLNTSRVNKLGIQNSVWCWCDIHNLKIRNGVPFSSLLLNFRRIKNSLQINIFTFYFISHYLVHIKIPLKVLFYCEVRWNGNYFSCDFMWLNRNLDISVLGYKNFKTELWNQLE